MDFSNSNAHWPNSGFNRFRHKLAMEIGMDLDAMEGFGDGTRPFSDFDHGIVPFLNHSDCDGELTPVECRQVSLAIWKLTKNWNKDGYDYIEAIKLSADLMKCSNENVPMIFK